MQKLMDHYIIHHGVWVSLLPAEFPWGRGCVSGHRMCPSIQENRSVVRSLFMTLLWVRAAGVAGRWRAGMRLYGVGSVWSCSTLGDVPVPCPQKRNLGCVLVKQHLKYLVSESKFSNTDLYCPTATASAASTGYFYRSWSSSCLCHAEVEVGLSHILHICRKSRFFFTVRAQCSSVSPSMPGWDK